MAIINLHVIDQYFINQYFTGVKIFNGVENGKLYCCPTPFVKYFYELGKNELKGQIEICNHGFHFCKNLVDALDYKDLFVPYKTNSYAHIMRPVSYVTTFSDGKIEAEFGSSLKFVTNKLNVDHPRSNIAVIKEYIKSCYYSLFIFDQIIDKEDKTIIHNDNFNIFFHTVDNGIIEIPNNIGKNLTIFSDIDSNLEVINKSKYTQYINRYDTHTQTIIAVPRKSKIKLNGGETISNPLFQVSYKISQL